MKIIFLGTPVFAKIVLEKMLAEKLDVVAVVTQPDRMRDRKKVTFSDVKQCALDNGIAVYQYEKVSREGVQDLRALGADIMITCAFGQILSQEMLDLTPNGVINVHASLLPKYRGSAPIQWCIIKGETETGITIMKTALSVDSGDILLQKTLDIAPDDTAQTLFDKLAVLGGEAIVEAVGLIESKRAVFVPQNHSLATHFPMIKKENGEIDFSMSAKELDCFIRGFTPWPSAYTYLNGERLKIFKIEKVSDEKYPNVGIVVGNTSDIQISVGDGVISVVELQAEGGKRMLSSQYLKGHKVDLGSKLGR